jgi:hypothetical protein
MALASSKSMLLYRLHSFVNRGHETDLGSTIALNKRYKKPKGQSKMGYPESLTTLGTQDTGRQRQKKTPQKPQYNTEN